MLEVRGFLFNINEIFFKTVGEALINLPPSGNSPAMRHSALSIAGMNEELSTDT